MGTTSKRPHGTSPSGNGSGRLCLRSLLLPPVLLFLALGFCIPRVSGASSVQILVDGRSLNLASGAGTVREALAEARIALDRDDQVSPPLDAHVPVDGVIRVTRIAYAEGTLEIRIPYQTVVRPATQGNRPRHPTVTGEGRNGLKRVTYRAKLVDGREVERATLTEQVVREPVHQVVTSRNPSALGSRGAYAGGRTLKMLATAYDPGPGSCGRSADGRTCNGKRAGYGVIAVDPKVIPLGSKLYVPGYGYGIAADVGGAIQGPRIDLGFNSRSGSFKWGKRWVVISIVD